MSTEATAVTSPESATGQAEQVTTPVTGQDTTKAVPSERERLIKALTEGTIDKFVEEVPKEEPVAEAKTAEGDDKAAEVASSVEAEKEEEKPAEKAASEPAAKKPEDVEDDDSVSDDEVAKDSSRTRKRITKLREQAAFGSLISTIGVRAGIAPQDMTNWVALRAGLAVNDPNARKALVDLAKQLDPTLAQPVTPPAPATPDPKEIEAETNKVYDEFFKAGVEAMQVDETYAKNQAKALAARRVVNRPAQTVAPQQTQTAPAAPTQSVDPIAAAATEEVNRMDHEYAAKMPGWDKMRNEVYEEIASKHRGAPPARWSAIFLEVAKNVQARHQKPPEKRVAPTPSLRGAGSPQNPGGTRPTGREDAVGILTGRIKL